ncbi:MAG: molybdenum cofactor guanylyltransferase [Sphingomonadales bacterium]
MQTRVLILAGGESRRMGQPKGLLDYHGIPQVQYLHNLALSMKLEAFVSCREEQKSLFSDLPVITDHSDYAGHGPISGLLSAFRAFEGNWLLLGCDYPALKKETITSLLNADKCSLDIICFKHPESHMAEPLIALYRHSAGKQLMVFFANGGNSLSGFIRQGNSHFIDTEDALVLKSIDTPEEKDAFMGKKHE